jgi:hypothetical protein
MPSLATRASGSALWLGRSGLPGLGRVTGGGVLGGKRVDVKTVDAAGDDIVPRVGERLRMGSISPVRTVASRVAMHAGIEPIQFALAGMNVHINHNLPLAVVVTCTTWARRRPMVLITRTINVSTNYSMPASKRSASPSSRPRSARQTDTSPQ